MCLFPKYTRTQNRNYRLNDRNLVTKGCFDFIQRFQRTNVPAIMKIINLLFYTYFSAIFQSYAMMIYALVIFRHIL